IIQYSAKVVNDKAACKATDITSSITTPDGVVHPLPVTPALAPGEETPILGFFDYMVKAQDVKDGQVSATARAEGDIHQIEGVDLPRGAAMQEVKTTIVTPCLQVQVQCTGGTGEGGVITFTGTVRNCGDVPLSGVVVTNLFDNT